MEQQPVPPTIQSVCPPESYAKFKIAGPASVVESSTTPPSFVITENTNPRRSLGMTILFPGRASDSEAWIGSKRGKQSGVGRGA
jgi:hypothetical protein